VAVRGQHRRATATVVAALVLAVTVGAPGTAVAKKKTTVKRSASKKVAPNRSTASTADPRKGLVKLGGLDSSVSASGARTLEEAHRMAAAWVDTTNAAGGVNGYRVQLLWRDNRSDTGRGAQNVKELDASGVLAIVGQDANAQLPTSDKLLQDKRLPVIGGVPYLPEFDDHPMYFPVSSGWSAGVYGQVAAARAVGATSFRRLFCTDTPSCAQTNGAVQAAGVREGLRVTVEGASAAATDFTSNCLTARSAGADFVQLSGVPMATVVRDCSRQNYHPVYGQAGYANEPVIDAAKGEAVAGNLFEFGVFYNGTETRRFRDALGRAGLELSGPNAAGQTSVETWLAFEMAGAVLKRVSQPNPTRQDFVNAALSLKGETLGGQIAPVDYTVQRPGTGLHAGNDCWTQDLVKDGEYYHMNRSGRIVDHLADAWICGSGKKYAVRDYSAT
jgi:branched-chain amino acid transport system substrate-binding protein